MPTFAIGTADEELVDRLVSHYLKNQSLISRFLESFHSHLTGAMTEPQPLSKLVHSVKRRMKEPSHLKDKLMRTLREAKESGKEFDITEDNLLVRVNDLGGYRILHLHTRQMGEIDAALRELLDVAQCDLFEQPFAYIWDDESGTYFQGIGIRTEFTPRMYSSVHYVVQPRSKVKVTYEIQVRTLADEIWGEIDHKINYPYPHESLACREQIKALARVASSCSRLVDSIVASHSDWEGRRKAEPAKRAPADYPLAAPPVGTKEAVVLEEHAEPATPAEHPREDARLTAIKQLVYSQSKMFGSCLEHTSGWWFEEGEAVFVYARKDLLFADLLKSREGQELLRFACAQVLGRPVSIRVGLEEPPKAE